jgi:hypothetical protein
MALLLSVSIQTYTFIRNLKNVKVRSSTKTIKKGNKKWAIFTYIGREVRTIIKLFSHQI